MATITVRGLDEGTVTALKVRAAREGRSMEAEARSILTSAVAVDDDERGFGTFLVETFGGVGAPPIPPRDEFPEPMDLP
ncbi:plasmid stabilization protein [Microbacterium bovistercoris]|uniref:Plasmid stabilization protein n=1 Tax=Microbacterium bovistercoris TaxID=2293570 RepID=A0A371NSI3_9MICO|nr:plasmid stabilization protein [Microbacterium bovistercoris]REJ05114.1 plasmid stabilization protein [Microbacterium bovistercoris]